MYKLNLFKNKGKILPKDKASEDLSLIKNLDKIFLEKRGFVIKIPERGDTVVACLSGGLDSVANIGILLQELKLNVYPFFVNRGQDALKWERESVKFFDKFYKEKYPKQYHKCIEINVITPPKEYKDLLRKTKRALSSDPLLQNIAYPARNPIIFLIGAEYAHSLKSKGENISTIFASHVSSDKSFHCSQTCTRLMNLLMCHILHDWNFQFISLPTETSLGNYFDKDVYVSFMNNHGIPIERTRSCVGKNKKQCGDCPPCWNRRRVIKELGLKDKTEYKFKMSEKCPTYYTHAD